MLLLFARHAESTANVHRIISNRNQELGLTELGRTQAAELADRLKGNSLGRIFSSPVVRAQETSAVIACKFHLAVQTTNALREIDCGVLEGRSDEASWEFHDEVYNDWIQYENYDRRIPGGESFLDVKERFIPFVESLLEGSDSEGNILLVGHGGLYHTMLPLILGNMTREWLMAHPFGNCNVLVCQPGKTGISAIEMLAGHQVINI